MPAGMEGYAAQALQNHIRSVVRDLRILAEHVDMISSRVEEVGADNDHTNTYGQVASAVIQQVMNALPNAMLGQLAERAAEADAYRAESQALADDSD